MKKQEYIRQIVRIAEEGFSTDAIRNLPELKLPDFQSTETAILSNAGININGEEALPQMAVGMALVWLYVKNRAHFGENNLSKAILMAFDESNFPVLTGIGSDEGSACALLCNFLNDYCPLSPEEGNFIFASGSVSAGVALFVWNESQKYLKTADIATALNLEAIRGEQGAFDARLHEQGRPFKGQIDSASNVRRMIAGSEMVTDKGRFAFGYDTSPRVQDAISVRATPQTHGGVRDMCDWLGDVLENELTTVPAGKSYTIEYALNILTTALCDLGNISERRTFRLNETRMSYGLPMNLVASAGFNHGYPVVQSVQTGVLGELKLDSLPTTVIKEDNSCMAWFAGVRLIRSLEMLSKILSVEILMCCQAMDIVQRKLPDFSFGNGTTAVWQEFRKHVEVLEENRFVAPDMVTADHLVFEGTLLRAAETCVGELE